MDLKKGADGTFKSKWKSFQLTKTSRLQSRLDSSTTTLPS